MDKAIDITKKAKERIVNFIDDDAREGAIFRIYVRGGGCSGFKYEFAISEPSDMDQTINFEDFEVAVDPMSMMYLEGSTVDWLEVGFQFGFKVINPNSTGSCGCGMSFSV